MLWAGICGEAAMPRDLSFEVTYPAPVGVVWRALTEAAELSQWLMPTDFAPVVGHRFTFTTSPAPGFDGIVNGEVLEIVPQERIRYSWVGGGIDTVVTWTLATCGASTVVRLTQSGFEGPRGLIVSKILGSGWKGKLLDRLGAQVGRIAAARTAG